jgi:hypothetical protein
MKNLPRAKKITNPIGMCIVALVLIFYGTLYFLITVPMWQKTITSGQYEALEIGASKESVLSILTSSALGIERARVRYAGSTIWQSLQALSQESVEELQQSNEWETTDIVGKQTCSAPVSTLYFESGKLREVSVKCFNHK